ncbi:MAG: class I SAM-dependent methyltransferase [Clostridia bacterium]|nr:class I SAM-dependent methyltransferase [Clostridia bacterium]
MNLEEIRDKWVSKNDDSKAAMAMWDSQAQAQCYHQIPSFDNNQFLMLMESRGMLKQSYDVLDIGCGAGIYSIAIADRVKNVTGVDISSKMIEHGKNKALELKLDNVNLFQADWKNFSLEDNGYDSHFDLVFAHMTPAVSCAATLEKMNAASKHYCILCKPTRRNDPVYFEVERIMGIEHVGEIFDETIINTFSMLWQLGYFPEFAYENQVWNINRTYEEACQFYINRAKQIKTLNDSDIDKAKDYLKSIEKDGIISECINTVITTISWEK